MRTRSFALLALCALAGCSAQGTSSAPSSTVAPVRVAGEHIVSIDSTVGEVRVTGRGGLTLGEQCVMDVVLSIEDNRLKSPTEIEGTYRVVRRDGTPAYVSKDGGPWFAVNSGEVTIPLLLLPLRISTRPLARYGGFLCAFGAVDDVAKVGADGSVGWDLEAVQQLSDESQSAYLEEVLAVSKLDRAAQACYREFLATAIEEGRSRSRFIEDSKDARVTLRREEGVIVYEEVEESGTGTVLRRERIEFQPTRWSIPDVEDLPRDRADLVSAVAGLRDSDTGC